MPKSFKNILILSIFSFLAFSPISFVYAQDFGGQVYFLYLWYDNGNLIIDKDDPTGFEVKNIEVNSDSEFDNEEFLEDYDHDNVVIDSESLYKAETISFTGNVLDSFFFDPVAERFDTTIPAEDFKTGKVLFTIPYRTNASLIQFTNSAGQQILSISVARDSSCNENNICESQRGESSFTCLSDCPLSSSDTTPTTRSVWRAFLPMIIWFGLAIVIGVGWFIIKTRRASQF